MQIRTQKLLRAPRLPGSQVASCRVLQSLNPAVEGSGMSEDCLTNVIQEELRCCLGTLNHREDGHPQMFQRCVHLAMGPTECVDDGGSIFVCKLFERHAG